MKQVIILSTRISGTEAHVDYLLWAPVPAGRESLWSGQENFYGGATQAEIDALTNGTVAQSYKRYKGTSINLAKARSSLESYWEDWNDYVQTHNPADYSGAYWDGTSWVTV